MLLAAARVHLIIGMSDYLSTATLKKPQHDVADPNGQLGRYRLVLVAKRMLRLPNQDDRGPHISLPQAGGFRLSTKYAPAPYRTALSLPLTALPIRLHVKAKHKRTVSRPSARSDASQIAIDKACNPSATTATIVIHPGSLRSHQLHTQRGGSHIQSYHSSHHAHGNGAHFMSTGRLLVSVTSTGTENQKTAERGTIKHGTP
ncbi:hypothetical protein BKA62DRAFT_675192 [Auriculariales sp. MPI-PUGE-AT-0066]|nr:hypothetical protein BKA62DRAFT_675192 [Auriculariales sp. MPI-PUGE-AT-0066]